MFLAIRLQCCFLSLLGLAVFWGCSPKPMTEHELTVMAPQPMDAIELEIAGDQAVQNGDARRACALYQQAIDKTDAPAKSLLDKLGQQRIDAGQPFLTIELLKFAIGRYPKDADLRQNLVSLYASLGLQCEAAEQLQWLVQHGHGNVEMLIMLSDLNRPQTVNAMCNHAVRNCPEDLRPQYSLSQLDSYHGRWKNVANQLKPVIANHPDFVPAQAFYGRAIVELQDDAAIERWSKALPNGIEQHPQYWLAAGIWAERQGDVARSIQAFGQSVRLDENNCEALSRLSANLAQAGLTVQSQFVSNRASNLIALRDAIDSFLSWRKNSQLSVVTISEKLVSAGRLWEATTWLQAAFPMTQNLDPKLTESYKSVRSKLTGSTPWQLPESLVGTHIDMTFPVTFEWHRSKTQDTASKPSTSSAGIRFNDEARERGLNHVCEIGETAEKGAGLGIHQSGAGGAGVIDFDLDGWADLYLSTSDGKPNEINSGPNRLWRNTEGKFSEVTNDAGVGDHGFTQGVTVGDYNADGWPDLYVANIGRNGLYRNNGDGSFTDVTDDVGLTGKRWTSSVAIADIDADGNADIFEVGYCRGENIYTQSCIDPKLQKHRSCTPLAFDAQPDRIWRGLGDGTFVDITDQWLANHNSGRGLGIVIGRLDADQNLDVYVANDMTANHFWTRDIQSTEDFRLSEQAMLRGLAVNARSLSQASMGIAAGDPDNDGDVDFLVTNFSDDYNTFYEQVHSGLWSDRSERVNLAAPSERMLAYGTQWIDADNDGSSELLVANGDIDDFTHSNRLFRQPFQLFDCNSDGRWFEPDRLSLGNYFKTDRLARVVVMLDADRDMQTDFLVTHLFEPVALLINQTSNSTNQVRFFLRATKSHPDAIGAQVTLESNGKILKTQLFAGNGYQCSTERVVSCGIGKAELVKNVVVHWPNGTDESFGTLPAGDYLITEGSGSAFAFTR